MTTQRHWHTEALAHRGTEDTEAQRIKRLKRGTQRHRGYRVTEFFEEDKEVGEVKETQRIKR